MPKAEIHFVIINGDDGSAHVNFYADRKSAQLAADIEEERGLAFSDHGPLLRTLVWDNAGVLQNPHSTKAELVRELAMARGDDELGEDTEETVRKTFNKAADKAGPFSVELHYIVRNGGGGEAYAQFYTDAESAQLASDIEEEGGEAFGEQPKSQSMTFDASGRLTNPDETYAMLKAELAERRGEEPEQDLAGKTVVFTGKLSAMTRKAAEEDAVARGAVIGSGVTKATDILVVGEDAGSKLAKAMELGVEVVTEAEWTGGYEPAPAKAPAKRGPKP